MTFEYTFGGEKIKKTSPDGERQYVGGMEYVDGGLELIHIPNGRITEKEGLNHYQYHLEDHLGNIVVLFEDVNDDGKISIEEDPGNPDSEIIQRNHYYSFGMRVDAPHFALSADPRGDYLYNGKELQEELGLNWLSYGFRMYDPAIGRFPSVDPIADRFAFVSGFNYAENSPIMYIDLWGLQAAFPALIGKDKQENFPSDKNPFNSSFPEGKTSEGKAPEVIRTEVIQNGPKININTEGNLIPKLIFKSIEDKLTNPEVTDMKNFIEDNNYGTPYLRSGHTGNNFAEVLELDGYKYNVFVHGLSGGGAGNNEDEETGITNIGKKANLINKARGGVLDDKSGFYVLGTRATHLISVTVYRRKENQAALNNLSRIYNIEKAKAKASAEIKKE
jgi:RHS repeat-associated protein